MKSKWSIAKYNRSIKAIRREHPKLDIARARATWKSLSEKLGKSASTVDVRKAALRKRGAKSSELSKAIRNSAAQTRRETVIRRAMEKPGRSRFGSTGAPSVRGKEKSGRSKVGRFREIPARQKTIPIRNLSDWYSYYNEIDYEEFDIAAGVDTGKED